FLVSLTIKQTNHEKKYILSNNLLTGCFVGYSAQVLFEEDFNSYPAGHLNTDYTGATTGQGGWLVERHANASATAMVVPETGKGNVLTITTNGTFSNEYIGIIQDDGIIDALWSNRTTGKNVAKLEFEVYGSSFFIASGDLLNQGVNFMTLNFKSTTVHRIETYHTGSGVGFPILKQYDATTFPYNIWIKAELFIDYNTQKAYFYIPTLNLFRADAIINNSKTPDNIRFLGSSLKSGSVVKFDNIKLTALQSVPAYIDALSTDEWLASQFNLYPNPAANVVNITNSENMQVQQVTVYDVTGKQLSMQTFNNETEIQLNVENLASGVYMLRIETNAGIAVKKLVKK